MMGNKTKIEWADSSWSPVTGCSHVSEGCRNCYAERITSRFRKDHKPWTAANAAHNVVLHPDRLEQPLHWRKPRKIFVCSMGDLFHEAVPDQFLRDVFRVMRICRQHIFQVLTKRPERLRAFCTTLLPVSREGRIYPITNGPHIWLGVSVEDQKTANERIPFLLRTLAAVKFVSYEPALGPLVFNGPAGAGKIDLVIAGGESGPNARPSQLDWFRSVKDQCRAAGVPFFMKQITSNGRKIPFGEWPEDLRVREFPHV